MADGANTLDWTGAVDFAINDLESCQYTQIGAPVATPYFQVTAEIVTASAVRSHYAATRIELQNGSRYFLPFSGIYGVIDPNSRDVVPMPCTVQEIGCSYSTPLAFGSGTFTYVWNVAKPPLYIGIDQDGTAGTPDTRVTIGPVGPLPAFVTAFRSAVGLTLAPGDLVHVREDSGTGGLGWGTYTTAIDSLFGDNRSIFPAGYGVPFSGPGTRLYAANRTAGYSLWQGPENDAVQAVAISGFGLRDWWLALRGGGIGAADSWSFTDRVNNAPGTLTIPGVTGAQRVWNDLVNVSPVPSDGVIGIEALINLFSGGAGPVPFTTAMVQETAPEPNGGRRRRRCCRPCCLRRR